MVNILLICYRFHKYNRRLQLLMTCYLSNESTKHRLNKEFELNFENKSISNSIQNRQFIIYYLHVLRRVRVDSSLARPMTYEIIF